MQLALHGGKPRGTPVRPAWCPAVLPSASAVPAAQAGNFSACPCHPDARRRARSAGGLSSDRPHRPGGAPRRRCSGHPAEMRRPGWRDDARQQSAHRSCAHSRVSAAGLPPPPLATAACAGVCRGQLPRTGRCRHAGDSRRCNRRRRRSARRLHVQQQICHPARRAGCAAVLRSLQVCEPQRNVRAHPDQPLQPFWLCVVRGSGPRRSIQIAERQCRGIDHPAHHETRVHT